MQVDTRRNDYQLRSVFHTIAVQPEIEPCIALILKTAIDLIGASGAAFHADDNSIANLSIGMSEADYIDRAALPTRPETLQYAQDGRLLLQPVATSTQYYGVLLLTFAETHNSDDIELDLLASLADSLGIVVARAQMQIERDQQRSLALSGVYSITDPLLIVDADGLLMLANPAAQTLFGSQVIVGSTLTDVIQSDDLLAFVAGEKALSEWSKGEKTFVPRIQPVGDATDQPDGWILALRDITRFKLLNRNQYEFIRIVSHDIRSPLTSIQGFASMLDMVGTLNERQSHFVEKVLSGITQITALVDNIQDAGRFDPETGFYEMIRTQCDLDELANRVVDNHLIPAEKQELTVLIDVADDVPIINADVTMLERALTNLIDNAIKYTPNGSEIKVSIAVQNNSVLIGVRDNGRGISPENQKLLFQRHVRIARKDHPKIKGSGLGLFIVKSVAQRHGGDAWVESVEGQGTTFLIGIPLEGQNLVIPDGS